MKILQIFGAVVAIHLLAFVFIFASPGCQSGSRNVPTPDATLSEAPLPAPAATSSAPSPTVTYTPEAAAGRATPTRPGSPNAVAITPPPPVAAEVAPVTTYTVERGDSLWSIARKNQLTVAELAKANNLSTGTVLQPGRKLIVPGKLPAAPVDLATGESPAVATYKVQPGDTLGEIARKHGTTSAALLAANNRTGNMVRVGEELKLPAGAKPVAPAIAEPVVTRAAEATVHVVQPGEKLGVIARKYGLTVAELATANNIADPSRIRAGQKLTIPGAKSSAKAPAKPSVDAAPPPPSAGANAPVPVVQPAADATPHFEIKAPPPGVDLDAGLPGATTEVPTIKVEETAPPKN